MVEGPIDILNVKLAVDALQELQLEGLGGSVL